MPGPYFVTCYDCEEESPTSHDKQDSLAWMEAHECPNDLGLDDDNDDDNDDDEDE